MTIAVRPHRALPLRPVLAPTLPARLQPPLDTFVPSNAKVLGRIIDLPLYDWLRAHPDVQTVQDLVNACYRETGGGWATFAARCRELGVDPAELAKFRSARLCDWAVVSAPAPGAPATVEAANAFFLTQYRTQWNPYYPSATGVSSNCGPASLAMCLRAAGEMPAGLNAEQQIDFARAQMYPDLAASAYRSVMDAAGNPVRLLDRDHATTSMGAVVAGANRSGLPSHAAHGWAALDAALLSGTPVVLEGHITPTWRAQLAAHPPGHYAGGGDGHFVAVLGKTADGKYLVADPMFSGGVVALTRTELARFFSGDPSFAPV